MSAKQIRESELKKIRQKVLKHRQAILDLHRCFLEKHNLLDPNLEFFSYFCDQSEIDDWAEENQKIVVLEPF